MFLHRVFLRAGLGVALTSLCVSSCDCNEINNFSAAGALEPAAYNFGPVVTGQSCTAELSLNNGGQADLAVTESNFVNTNGTFEINGIVPAFVSAFASDTIEVKYTAGAANQGNESATLRLKTNTPANDGVLEAILTGTPVVGDAAMLQTRCTIDTVEHNPCTELSFGATVVATTGVGVTRTLRVLNDGTDTMNVLEPVVLENQDFTFENAYVADLAGLGGAIEVTAWPVELQPARGECGSDSGNVRTYVDINVTYRPNEVGADLGKLRVVTDASVEPSQIDLDLIGIGSGDGIETDPNFVQFGEVAVNDSRSVDIRVFNLRMTDASINNSCIDSDLDGSCDIPCTAVDESSELSCGVEKSDGSHEGKGFVLSPADAQAGGDDERVVEVRWAPTQAGPLRAALRLETSIGDSRVWTVPLIGGVAGTLSPSQDPLTIPTTGTAPELVGSATFTISNTGQAPLTISRVEFDPEASTAISSEFTLTRQGDASFQVSGDTAWTGSLVIAQAASESFTIDYANGVVVNCDSLSLEWTHDGNGQIPYPQQIEVAGDACD